ncbi:DUF3592 domain-containing protein [Terrimonas pollutisoli]|uniref:DUF3592 domain-containing protein n=1 Tax=Terrimonas pollutisoli TaxID=3034147 RepID=UPI0023ED1C6D|nr:DUF3592 domain-containing protein [Terrimonas sp. H1YJ31]
MTLLEIIGSLFFFCLGLYMFRFGFNKHLTLTKLKREGQSIYAEVISLKRENQSFVPIVSFTDYKDIKITGVPKNSIFNKYFSFHKVGDKVKIFYNSEDSSDFAIDELSDKITVMFFYLGGSVFMLAVLYEIFRRII